MTRSRNYILSFRLTQAYFRFIRPVSIRVCESFVCESFFLGITGRGSE